MRIGWPASAIGRVAQLKVLGAVAAATIAAVVYCQFDLYGKLSRDSAIYIYGGQRFVHGVPPYASVMDPKGPLSSILCGFGVAVARLFGRSDVLVIRLEFFVLTMAAAIGMYLLVLALCDSVVAGVVAAAVFAWFRQFAHQALVGPDGHTPGVVFLIFAMWLTARRQWYLAGFAAMLAFVSWQPLFPYPVIALVCAAVWTPGHRIRAVGRCLAGVATPLVALIVYYAAEGYPGKLFEGLFLFPVVGARRRPVPFGNHVRFIVRNIANSYHSSAVLLWVGLGLLLALALWTVLAARSQWRAACLSPLVLLVVFSLVTQLAYVLYDYIGWTHAFPLLPYSAIGFGLTAALLLARVLQQRARRVVAATLLAAVSAVTVVYAVSYARTASDYALPLRSQQASACAIQRSLAPRTPLWTLGDPLPLVLLHRVNPDNYPYEGTGLDSWKVEHTPGGFGGWTAQIRASRASVVVLDAWNGPYKKLMQSWLSTHGYRKGYIGPFRVYVTPAARAQMRAHSIRLDRIPLDLPLTTARTPFDVTTCTKIAAG